MERYWIDTDINDDDPHEPEEVRFFKADTDNFGSLAELFQSDLNERYRQISDRSIDIYAAACAGKPIGRLIANYSNQHLENETLPNVRACISHFILFKEYRNRGIGSRLLKFALNDLRSHGYSEFTVGVEDENRIAKHIYFENGFAEKIGHGSTPCEYDLYLKR